MPKCLARLDTSKMWEVFLLVNVVLSVVFAAPTMGAAFLAGAIVTRVIRRESDRVSTFLILHLSDEERQRLDVALDAEIADARRKVS